MRLSPGYAGVRDAGPSDGGRSIPRTRTSFSRDRSPRTSDTADRRTPNSSATKRSRAVLAFPSTAGAAIRTRRRSPDASRTSLRFAPGCTRNDTVIPPSPARHHVAASVPMHPDGTGERCDGEVTRASDSSL